VAAAVVLISVSASGRSPGSRPNLARWHVSADTDSVSVDTDSVAVDTDAVAVDTGTVASDTDSVAVDTDSVAAVAADTDSVAIDIDAVADDTDSVAIDIDAVAADTDSVAVDPDPAEIDTGADLVDTDSVAADVQEPVDTTLILTDSTAIDSLLMSMQVLADTIDSDTTDTLHTPRADFYLPSRPRDLRTASPIQRRKRPFYPGLGSYWRHEVELDSTEREFTIRESVGESMVRYPLTLDFERYRQERLAADLDAGWHEAIEVQRRQRASERRGGLGFNVVVPGGQQSAFTTIFGKPEVDLRVNGRADIRAGFDYRKSDQQISFTGKAARLDPDFKQDLQLGITGSIGDKLQIDVNWDTNNQFDFQNQLRLQYRGYEDEIIQSIEAGNVHLTTPSRLIRGGQSLFGIKSELQMGGLRLTTVASQQEGQSNTLDISGGSETTEFELKPTQYDENTHYFLAYYFRNRWEDALSQPPNILLANGFDRITDIEVWKLEPISSEEENARHAVAMVDLAEPAELVDQADEYTDDGPQALPSAAIDRYDEADLEQRLRNGTANPDDYLLSGGLSDDDYQPGRFKKLVRNRDYSIDPLLGYISLEQSLNESEALAVSYTYMANGQVYKVGDLSTETGGSTGGQTEDRLVLKLLKPVQLRQPALEQNFNPAAWYLELRNIYRVPGRGFNPTDFELQIEHQPPGKPASKTVPEIAGQRTLLDVLGLDRLNVDGAVGPDDRFDYLQGVTIEPTTGKLIFPYLQPFGNRIARTIDALEIAESEKERRKNLYAFNSLYTNKKTQAEKETQFDVYRIRGGYKGAVQDYYDLKAFAGVIEGSVRVTSGGSRLAEGQDYVVDYTGGTVTITNPAYLSAGRDIEISYEQNSFFNLQKKTLLGARADYVFGPSLALGGTIFNLNQKSPIDKFRIGEEPISNTIWGVDGALDLQPTWLTRAVDALPFIQTRAPSSIHVTGEFAQLRPGASETIAFERSRKELDKQNRDFKSDELQGISYLDDFEGFEITYSLKQPGAWRLTAAPDSIGRVSSSMNTVLDDSLRTNWRGTLGWYTLNQNVLAELKMPLDASVARVHIADVFPNRDITGEVDPYIQTLDYYYDPFQRGPYNYTTDLREFLDNPRDTWGGITQRIPEGYTDFGDKNIEFIEFVFRPFPENQQFDAGASAKLYVDLGSISEDVIPNGRLNTEDGLSLTSASAADIDEWSRLSRGTATGAVDVDDDLGRTEDLGLDGLASYDTTRYLPLMVEHNKFRHFLDALDPNDQDPRYAAEREKARRDPSGDDYYFYLSDFFNDREVFPGGASIQERFTRFFAGMEINSFEAQNTLAPNVHGKRGNSAIPDTEDLNLNSNPDSDNSYFQYELPLSKAVLDSMSAPDRVDDYVVTQITSNDGAETGWYQVRIPVRDFSRQVGSIQDFSLIESIRMWTTGNEVPITLRFATLELVGAQWQISDAITLERELPSDTLINDTRLSVSSINNEENSDTYYTPLGTIISQNRLANGRVQNAREQAMALRVENLMPGKQRAIYKTYSQGVDLLKYANLRMFSHMHGLTGDMQEIESRDKVTLFIRLGANERNDYYEYEMPLTPSPITAGDPDALWQTNQSFNGEVVDLNSINLKLSALNQLKVSRDERAFPTDSVYWTDLNEVPLSPSLDEFAPPGTRLGIKGTPSLGRINTIVIGVRNAADSTFGGAPNRRPEDILEDVAVWVNEMRVSGYDETNGWAAMANADIRLADLGQVKASFQAQTDGFGGLESTLGEREQRNLNNWSVTTDLNLDKFIPERFGWTIPVSVQVQSNTSTPRFSPNRGDIRLEELISQIDEDELLTEAERSTKKQEAIEAAQTATRSQSFNTRLQKTGSDSRLLRNTIDGLSFNYSLSNSAARNPSQQMNDSWRWTTTLNYRLNIRRPRTVKPFWFLDFIPIIGALSDLQFNYAPQSITTSATAARNFSESKDRPRTVPGQERSNLPTQVEFPLRQQHALSHRRNFAMQYNPFQFLNLSFDTNTNQSLNALGIDTLSSVIVRNPDRSERYYPNVSRQQAIEQGLVADSLFGVSAFEIENLYVVPSSKVVNRIFSGDEGLRTERHDSRLTGSFRPNLSNISALDWISLQDVVYGTQFGWQNGAVGRNHGANVSNNVEVRGGITLKPQDLFRKIPFYRSLEEAQQQAVQDREARRREAEEERQRRQQERELRRAAEDEETAAEDEERAAEDEETVDEDAAAAPADTTAAAASVEEEDDGGGGFRLPLPNPVSLLRRTVLAVTGIRDFTITYSANRSASSSNVGRPFFDAQGEEITDVETSYSLLDALRGQGPSIGYRLGFDRHVDLDQRIIDPSLQVTDIRQNTNRLQGRTALNPTPSLQVNLTWNADWDSGSNYTFRSRSGSGIESTFTSNGSNRASVWAFNANYLDLFERQLDTYHQDANLAPGDGLEFGDENGDGRVVLTNESIVEDFRETYLSGLGTVDGRGFLPFPMPNWQVTYSGIGNWPLIRSLVQSASLRHGYSSDYTTDFRQNPIADNVLRDFDLGGHRIHFTIPLDEVGAMRINERFQPVVGLDLSFEGRLQTNVAWNKSTSYSLSTSNFEVSENETSEITFTTSYQKQGMTLPFFGKRLNNRVSLSLTVSRSTLGDQRFSIRRGLVDAITSPDFVLSDALEGDNVSIVTASTRVTVVPRVSYEFSNRVSADFTMRYENFQSEDSRQPSATTMNGGFNIRVSIANN